MPSWKPPSGGGGLKLLARKYSLLCTNNKAYADILPCVLTCSNKRFSRGKDRLSSVHPQIHIESRHTYREQTLRTGATGQRGETLAPYTGPAYRAAYVCLLRCTYPGGALLYMLSRQRTHVCIDYNTRDQGKSTAVSSLICMHMVSALRM